MNGGSWFVGSIDNGEVVVITLGGDSLSLITPRVAASLITLEVGAGIGQGCTMRNILSKQRNSTVCYVPIGFYGAKGAGFSRPWMRYHAAWVAESTDEVHVLVNYHGKIDSVTDLRCSCFINVNLMTTVMLHLWS